MSNQNVRASSGARAEPKWHADGAGTVSADAPEADCVGRHLVTHSPVSVGRLSENGVGGAETPLALAQRRYRAEIEQDTKLWGANNSSFPTPDFEGNATEHRGVVHTMLFMDTTMNHLHIFKSWRTLWRNVGRYYNDLDVWGGWCFVVGSILFTLGPWLSKNKHVSADGSSIILMVGVVLFLFAKIFVELRAIYATLWERKTRRPGTAFHVSVISLTVGGLFFLATTILSLRDDPRSASWCSFLSAVGFLFGTFVFSIDSAAQFSRPLFAQLSNFYYWGALGLFLGSVFYIFSTTCDLSGVRDYGAVSTAASFAPLELCSESMVAWFNILGGLLYTLGSVFFLVFAYDELYEARRGPDPRCVDRNGIRAPHPFRPREGTKHEHHDPQPDLERFPQHHAHATRTVTCV
ncbi:uncharacterized protein MONBRDRAFT_39321 [Monosiga brevicollis MX1]|uniref:YrhK domain-containing protein n=1 Tax=Monosiga brevicollis TaxID=81824 RepID=A9VDR1_MONBE|nr:uncharacterized protein MONBRDRAFT_39321 [Monosiga brevicollis MX1]EDQ84365.1 predicted protein [Monosiga brevicollis MX1]|eukprot:XP_001750861.1 hypothetical protein [Monosiga brevicollis MX1]